jgi:hypothetical protein
MSGLTVVIHTRDHRRYLVDESSSARRVMERIRAGRSITCRRSDWVSGTTSAYEATFNPDNVVSVTEVER